MLTAGKHFSRRDMAVFLGEKAMNTATQGIARERIKVPFSIGHDPSVTSVEFHRHFGYLELSLKFPTRGFSQVWVQLRNPSSPWYRFRKLRKAPVQRD